MKNIFALSAIISTLLIIPNFTIAQCGATVNVITTTNQGEIAIDFDLSGMTDPTVYFGRFWVEHQTSGYRTGIVIDQANIANTVNLTLAENGTYTYYAMTHNPYWDSIQGTVVIANGLPDCGTSFTSNQSSTSVYDFNATSTFSGMTANPNYEWTYRPYRNSPYEPGVSMGTTNPITFDFSIPFIGMPYANVMLTVDDPNCHSTVFSQPLITVDCYSFFSLSQTANPAIWIGTNTSIGNNLTYTWDFGDGGSSNLQYPTHTYSNVGYYNISLTVDDGNGCSHTSYQGINVVVKSSTTLMILDTNTVNINEEEKISELNVFPNPSKGEFNVQFNSNETKISTISVLDLQGRIVYSEIQSIFEGANQIPLDLTGTDAGIYLLKMDNQLLEKLIIE